MKKLLLILVLFLFTQPLFAQESFAQRGNHREDGSGSGNGGIGVVAIIIIFYVLSRIFGKTEEADSKKRIQPKAEEKYDQKYDQKYITAMSEFTDMMKKSLQEKQEADEMYKRIGIRQEIQRKYDPECDDIISKIEAKLLIIRQEIRIKYIKTNSFGGEYLRKELTFKHLGYRSYEQKCDDAISKIEAIKLIIQPGEQRNYEQECDDAISKLKDMKERFQQEVQRELNNNGYVN